MGVLLWCFVQGARWGIRHNAKRVCKALGRFSYGFRDGENYCKVVLAQASQQAIQMVSEAIGNNETPVVYLLGEKYVHALQDISQSANAKTVVLPADLPAAVKGMMGK